MYWKKIILENYKNWFLIILLLINTSGCVNRYPVVLEKKYVFPFGVSTVSRKKLYLFKIESNRIDVNRMVESGIHSAYKGNWRSACKSFLEAYKLIGHKDCNDELLYNLGVCNEVLGRKDKALFFYQKAYFCDPRRLYYRAYNLCCL